MVIDNEEGIDIPEEEIQEEEVDTEEEVIEESDTSEEDVPETIQDEEEDEEDRIVSIGDTDPEEGEEEHQEAPGWVKATRKANRKLTSEVKRLQKRLEELTTEKPKPVELGEEPTLKAAGYDEAKYKQQLIEYSERKRQVAQQEAEQKKAVEEQQKAWQQKRGHYDELKAEHGFKDFSDAEEAVISTLSQTQQSVIVQGAKDPALLVYALGKNQKIMDELAKKDPVAFIFEVARLESKLKVSNKKAPKPEKRVSSGKAGGLSGNSDKQLEKLREEAAKTGDYTKVTAYKKKLRKKDS